MMALMSDEPAAVTATARVDDPTEASLWRPVFRLLSDMDDEIARVYADNGIEDLKTSWVLEIVRLHARGPMTIAELARSAGRYPFGAEPEGRGDACRRLAGNRPPAATPAARR